MVEPVAEALGNTVAMSRKSYVHPALLEAVKEDPRDPLDGMDRPRARKRACRPRRSGCSSSSPEAASARAAASQRQDRSAATATGRTAAA